MRPIFPALAALAASALAACGGASSPGPTSSPAPVDPARSSLVGTPASVVANGVAGVTFTVTARDASGRTLPRRATSFTLTGPGMQSAGTFETATDGTAWVTVVSTVAGECQVAATVDGVALAAGADGTFVAGPPARLAFTVEPGDAVAGALLAPPVEVTVLDAWGNLATSPVEPVTLSLAGGDPLFGTTSVTAPSGVASFPDVSVHAAAVGRVLRASLVGAQGAASAPFDVTAGAPSATRSSLVAIPSSVPANGTPATLTVTIVDAYGNPIAGVPVALLADGDASFVEAIVTTASTGVATSAVTSVVEGVRTFTASMGGIPVATATVRFTPLEIVGGRVFGLTGDGLVLAAAGQELPVPAGATSFTFPAKLPQGSKVTVAEQPGAQSCGVYDESPTIGAAGGFLVTCGPRWKQVAGGWRHTVALTETGDVYAWGSNYRGQLGDGTTTQREAPVLVGSGFVAVAAGLYHSLALTAGGDVYAWGANDYGQLGDGTYVERHSPVLVGSGYQSIAAGGTHSLAIRTTGELRAWGNNYNGQLGIGSTSSSRFPVLVGTGYAAVAGGLTHSLAVTTGGALRAWGSNGSGQLGDGTTVQRTSPVLVSAPVGTTFAKVAGGQSHSLAVTTTGDLYAWGDNSQGQLGDATTTSRTAPVLVGSSFAEVAAGAYQSLAVRAGGDLYAWGRNARSPVLMGSGITRPAAGYNHSLAISTRGELFAWGENLAGQLGNGTAGVRDAFARISSDFVAVSAGTTHSLGLRANGDLYAWGSNQYGQLGDGTTTERDEPVLVGTAFASVSAGEYHTVAVKTNGDLWAWGRNDDGELGIGAVDFLPAPHPDPVLVGTGFLRVSGGTHHSLGVKQDGGLWAWGRGTSGELGDGSAGSVRARPFQVATGFADVAAASSHSLARTPDGDVYAWGANDAGQIGDGTATRRLDPVLVATGAVAIAAGSRHSHAVLADGGGLLAWGENGNAQLGDGTKTQRLSPTRVGSGFVSISVAAYQGFGVKTDGGLYAWGANSWGQFGNAAINPALAPTLLDTGVVRVAAGWGHALVVRGDGGVFAAGYDYDGELGDGHRGYSAAPMVVSPAVVPDHLRYAPPALDAGVGVPTTVVPSWSGVVTAFDVSPDLPPGLLLDPSTGIISGSPTSTAPAASYEITATGPAGRTSVLLTITVN